MTTHDVADHLPLGTPVLHVLLALGRERRHGYGIMLAIEEKSGGEATILPGTLYTTLNRMAKGGLIEEAEPPADAPDDDRRRSYYRATELGLEVLEAETRRLSMLVRIAERDLEVR